MLGLAVMVAVVLGVGTTALAAVPGDPFRLGEINAINAASRLTGTVAGPLLSLENDFVGSKAATGSALSLKVQQKQPPLVVNPEAGKATNLDSDELDGKDSSAFLATGGKAADADRLDGKDSAAFASGTNGKANDADMLDGKDSGQFLASNAKAADSDRLDGQDASSFWTGEVYNLGSSPVTGTPFAETFHGAGPCDPGDAAIGGNFRFIGNNGDHEIVSEQLFPDDFAISWNNGPVADTLNVNVTCADFPPLRP